MKTLPVVSLLKQKGPTQFLPGLSLLRNNSGLHKITNTENASNRVAPL